MSQHDTLTLREALRSIQYEAASLADAQVIALQALNATYPARTALSATQPAKAAQSEPAEHWHRLYLEKCQQYNDRVAQLGGVSEGLEAEAAQGAGEVVAWAILVDDKAVTLLKSKGVAEIASKAGEVVRPLAYADTQPAAGADVLDAKRYRLLRCYALRGSWPDISQNPGVLVFTAHPDEAERFTLERLDAMLDRMLGVSAPGNISELRADYFEWRKAKTQVAIDAAIAASGRQE